MKKEEELKQKIISLMEEMDKHQEIVVKCREEINRIDKKYKAAKVESIIERNSFLVGKYFHHQSRVRGWTLDEFFKVNGFLTDSNDDTISVVTDRLEIEREDDVLTKHTFSTKVTLELNESWYGSLNFNPAAMVEITEEEFNRQLVNFK